MAIHQPSTSPGAIPGPPSPNDGSPADLGAGPVRRQRPAIPIDGAPQRLSARNRSPATVLRGSPASLPRIASRWIGFAVHVQRLARGRERRVEPLAGVAIVRRTHLVDPSAHRLERPPVLSGRRIRRPRKALAGELRQSIASAAMAASPSSPRATAMPCRSQASRAARNAASASASDPIARSCQTHATPNARQRTRSDGPLGHTRGHAAHLPRRGAHRHGLALPARHRQGPDHHRLGHVPGQSARGHPEPGAARLRPRDGRRARADPRASRSLRDAAGAGEAGLRRADLLDIGDRRSHRHRAPRLRQAPGGVRRTRRAPSEEGSRPSGQVRVTGPRRVRRGARPRRGDRGRRHRRGRRPGRGRRDRRRRSGRGREAPDDA